jgi:23S rRNA (guanosine2251-2'-O)-methyltransferase
MRIEGRRSVLAAVKAGRARHLYIAEGAKTKIIEELREAAEDSGIAVEMVPRARLDSWSETGAHQGVMADVKPATTGDWREAVDRAKDSGEVPLLVALDSITDPHNAGAIIRSAAAFGAHGVLVPDRRAATVNATVAKAAAGALEVVGVFQVASLQAALEDAKQRGLWVVALAEAGSQPLESCELLGEPCVIVVGAEGRGVSRTVLNLADATVAITTSDRFSTLNASVAAAITLHAASRTSRS